MLNVANIRRCWSIAEKTDINVNSTLLMKTEYIGIHFYLRLLLNILAQLNEFAQSMCKVVIISAVCGMGPTIAYYIMRRSLANVF